MFVFGRARAVDGGGGMAPVRTSVRQSFSPGIAVVVRNRYEMRWIPGFEVEHGDDARGYVLRRRCDGVVLPASFSVGSSATTAAR
jgi:hypothetical protein